MTPIRSLLLAAWALGRLGACATCLEQTPFVPQGWEPLDGAPDGAYPLRLSIALRLPHADGLGAVLRSGARLSVHQTLALRTPDAGHVRDVVEWLADNGIVDVEPDKDWVHVRTTVAKAEKLLDMKLRRYSFASRPPVLRTTRYSVPDSLADAVSFVHPIANFMTPTHDVAGSRPMVSDQAVRQRDVNECSVITRPDCILKQYNITYSTPDGASPVRLAVAGFLKQFANYKDTSDFLKRTRPALAAAGYNYSVELVQGGQNPQDPAAAGSEASLDIQYAMAIGYPAQVRYFSTGGKGVKLNDSGKPFPDEDSDNEPYLGLLDHLLKKPDDQLPHVLSMSYADDELSVPRPYAERTCCMFGLLAARGTSVLVGSGDGGARGGSHSSCRTNDGTNRDVTMATFPGTCPWVTAVGAVTNKPGPPKGADFSTGGFSQWFRRETWQDASVQGYIKALNGHLQGYYDPEMRALPDISAVGTAFMTQVGGESQLLDGTSASTPVIAAMIALINDARLRKGKPALGWLNPKLYSDEVRSVLVDTTVGQSVSCEFEGKRPGGWPAKVGWDAITGLGTPGNFDDLMRVLVHA